MLASVSARPHFRGFLCRKSQGNSTAKRAQYQDIYRTSWLTFLTPRFHSSCEDRTLEALGLQGCIAHMKTLEKCYFINTVSHAVLTIVDKPKRGVVNRRHVLIASLRFWVRLDS